LNTRKKLVREEVLRCATELFAEKGYAGTTTQNIADAVGLKRTSLYYYFKTKDELLEALIEEVTVDSAKRNEAIRGQSTNTVLERIGSLVQDTVLRTLERPLTVKVLDRIESELPESLLGGYVEAKRSVRDEIIALVTEGIENGELIHIDPRVATFALIGMANWTAWWFAPGKGLVPEEIAQSLSRLATRALANNNSAKEPQDLFATVREDLDELERHFSSSTRQKNKASDSRS